MWFYVIFYIFLGLSIFCSFNAFFDNEKFYKIFKKRWMRIICRLTWLFLWPLWCLLFAVIFLVFLFRIFIKVLTK